MTLDDGGSIGARRLLVATGVSGQAAGCSGGSGSAGGARCCIALTATGGRSGARQIGVLGSGPVAVHQALMFRQLSADVVLFRHTSPTLSEEQAEQLAARDITVVDGEVS